MNIPSSIAGFWARFEAASGVDQACRFYEAFHFDDNERNANALAALVLQGRKHATASLLWTYEYAGKPLPQRGSLSVVTDWAGAPQCVIETEQVNVVPYSAVTEDFAAAEGEGDRTLAYWRDVHWAYFARECARMGRKPDPGMLVVCEAFSVIYPDREASGAQGEGLGEGCD